jgi:hypothetical protein
MTQTAMFLIVELKFEVLGPRQPSCSSWFKSAAIKNPLSRPVIKESRNCKEAIEKVN